MPSETSPLTGRRFQALLNDPDKARELWDLIQEKYRDSLESEEKYLQEEAEGLGLSDPFNYLRMLKEADPKQAVRDFHYQNPELDLSNLKEEPDYKVATAVLATLSSPDR